MDSLILNLTNNPGAWEAIFNWLYSFIGNFGWVVIILTVAIRLLLSPVDFLQKKSMKKMTAANTLLQPELQKIKEKCGNNQELYNQKVQELYKRHNVNPMSGCGTMLIYMVLTTFIFITLFNGMRGIATEQINREYNTLVETYVQTYNYYNNESVEINGITYTLKEDIVEQNSSYKDFEDAFIDATIEDSEKANFTTAKEYARHKVSKIYAQQAVVEGITLKNNDANGEDLTLNGYDQIKQSFLWIRNIWRSDNYNSVFPNANEFISSSGIGFNEVLYKIDASEIDKYETEEFNSEEGQYYVKGYYQTMNGTVITESANKAKEAFILDYTDVTKQINVVYSGWNGYFILVILAGALTFLSQFLSNVGSKTRNKHGEQVAVAPQKKNNIMSIIMVALFVWITWSYTAAFALYIVASSLIGIISNILINLLVNKYDDYKAKKQEINIEYSRY